MKSKGFNEIKLKMIRLPLKVLRKVWLGKNERTGCDSKLNGGKCPIGMNNAAILITTIPKRRRGTCFRFLPLLEPQITNFPKVATVEWHRFPFLCKCSKYRIVPNECSACVLIRFRNKLSLVN